MDPSGGEPLPGKARGGCYFPEPEFPVLELTCTQALGDLDLAAQTKIHTSGTPLSGGDKGTETRFCLHENIAVSWDATEMERSRGNGHPQCG